MYYGKCSGNYRALFILSYTRECCTQLDQTTNSCILCAIPGVMCNCRENVKGSGALGVSLLLMISLGAVVRISIDLDVLTEVLCLRAKNYP